MPKRTNDFQKLVFFIESQLANTDSQVKESVLMVDEKGVEREIDILINARVNKYEINIALECREHKRKGDVIWIDQIEGKYERLSKINKVIAVSASGFSKNAKELCEKSNKIQLMTLEDAKKADWNSIVFQLQNIRATYNKYFTEKINILNCEPSTAKNKNFPESSDKAQLFHRNVYLGNIEQYIIKTLNEARYRKQLNEITKLHKDKYHNNIFRFECVLELVKPPDFFTVVDPDGEKWNFRQVIISIKAQKEIFIEPIEKYNYGDTHIGTAIIEKGAHIHKIGIVQERNKELKIGTVDWKLKSK